MVEFGTDLSITYVMGGLARDYTKDYADADARITADRTYETLLLHWLDRAAQSGMPIDPRLWSEGPIRSTYPACMAVKAAQEQGPEAAERYLRAVREGLLCFRRKLDGAEALVEEARTAGLDVQRFRIDLESHAIVEAFGADLDDTRSVPDEARSASGAKHGQGGERVVFPSLRFEAEDGAERWVFGSTDYGAWRDAAAAAGATGGAARPAPLDALRRFGRMATAEVEAVCDLPGPRAPAELWRLASEWRVKPVPVLTGTLWELAA
jgi:hypothetical protein